MSNDYRPEDFHSPHAPAWCKGCSFYSVLSALTKMLSSAHIDPQKVNIISGIGCSSRMPFYMSTPGIHTLHGRAIPVATGARLANPEIPVLVIGGDGDLFSIGAGHFIHAARNNFNMTVLCLDNHMFAMTHNQTSPTSPGNHKGSLTPRGHYTTPLNPLRLAVTSGATFVARTYAGSVQHMKEIFLKAFNHEGFSFVQVLAPCLIFGNNKRVADIFSRVYDVNSPMAFEPAVTTHDSDPTESFVDYGRDSKGAIPVGVFLIRHSATYESKAAIKNQKTVSVHEYIDRLRITE